ncbi:hypothetical protein HPB52_024037 [Rhipicephalus sanguineus]|uniref:Monocarboxylate transporter n=1 Tax=Rhipicephalus sanguineus TaxID=34632 RepID=A0A9D4PZ55_RHISA|nr:hypothetical protein HPB52_024037 [Rhipicephalus sanguineus]
MYTFFLMEILEEGGTKLVGAATCGAVLMTQVCINQHFIRRRGTAAGVVSAISSLNCVIFPPLYEYWMSHYDLHWSFLLLGASILNSMAFGLLVRSPSWLIVNPVDYSKRRKSIFTRANVANKGLASWITHFSEDNSDSSDEEGHLEASRHLSGSVRYFFSEGGGISTSDSQTQIEMMPVRIAPVAESQGQVAHQLLIRTPDPLVTIPTGYTLCKPLEPTRGGHFQLKQADDDEGDKRHKFWKIAKTFLTISFWHLTLSQFLVQFGLGVFLLTIIDFSNDCGIGAKDSVFFMTSFCIGDMLSRVVTGLIADRGSVYLEFVVALAYVLQGVCYEFMCYIKSYLYLLLLTLGIGISHGSRIFLLPIFLTRSFGLRGLSVNLSVATCICGVLALFRPLLIGQRVFGVIYVGILETFHVTRQEASWPMSIIDLLASLSNPAFGYLCSRFSCRLVLLCCGFAGPLGIILCYFAADVTFITVFYGILNVHGKQLCRLRWRRAGSCAPPPLWSEIWTTAAAILFLNSEKAPLPASRQIPLRASEAQAALFDDTDQRREHAAEAKPQ